MTNTTLSPDVAAERLIVPKKGSLELWYQDNMSISTDILLIIITIVSIFYPSNKLLNKAFPNAPL